MATVPTNGDRAAEAASTAEERFRLLADAAPTIVWTATPDGAITWVSAQWYRYTGLSPELDIRDWPKHVLHPDDRARCIEAWTRHLRDGLPYEIEVRNRRHDGAYRWFLTRALPRRDAAGRVVEWVGSNTDIHDRKVVEERLTASEERLRLAQEAGDMGVWSHDLTRSVITGTRTAFTLFDLEPEGESLPTEAFRARMHPEDRPRVAEAVRAAAAGERDYREEFRIVRGDGAVRWLAARGRVVRDADGRAVAIAGVNFDITERRRAEAALRESQDLLRRLADTLESRVAERTRELAGANRRLRDEIAEREKVEATLRQMQRLEAVGQLTAGVAHDFNNLLTVVLGNVALLQPGLDDPTALRRLDQMRLAAERGAKLTRQLLAFARRQRLDPRPTDLNQVLSAMHDLLQSTMGGSIRIETELTGGLWPAMVDPTQLELVVLNLAINARDAMPSGGTLAVRTANATVATPPAQPGEPAPGDYVTASVADNGIGMTPEILAKAFEPFFTTKEVGRGSGLGLAQVYGFATQSGGGVRVDTTHGRGTTVTVFVPRAPAAAPAAVERDGATVALVGRGRRILLVDDDDAVREVTGSRLRALGFEVAEAASGEAALAALERGDGLALLLLDLAMPGMNGAEVAHRARARQPTLPLLFLTGHPDQAALREFGDAMILQKPVDDAQLASRLRAALRD